MSSPSKNSSKGAPKGSQRQLQKVSRNNSLFSCCLKVESSDSSGYGESKGESKSSTVGSETVEVPLNGPDGKTVFKPKHLTICWRKESKYWSIPEEDDGPAELREVCWLDVSGEMDVTKGKTYEVSFMLSMNTEKSFGWDDPDYPVMVMARIGKAREYVRKKIKLSELKGEVMEFPPDKCRVVFKNDEKSESEEELPAKKSQSQTKSTSDENPNNDEEKLYFGLYEVWSNKWKGGLRIHEAIVQEIPAGNNVSTSNTRSDESEGRK
ncbi:PREDICTED: protein PHLOEM PROTEIN 2-LIKE A9-like [Populus euphratica]|uniref:Protein PHLOEM PROTEIN 2-LIKE A9-like n=1 Tax=Populus euphratica TaxID=75702 RepID=A0AAJ6SX51_POPEU|nr:PREDICTED: protein PHLOEM PROTEIN 2-LIKE A9-like [Populus euphratica]